ncbi:MAG: hypothetical protein WCX88_03670 [Patescibacteria group bacterium]
MEGPIILKEWRDRSGKATYPISENKKIIKCFHEKQTEPRPGDPVCWCMVCHRNRVDVDAMREQNRSMKTDLSVVPKILLKLLKLRILIG